MKRLLLSSFLLLASCYARPIYYAPVGAVAVPPGEAERIAMNFARSQGLNPIGIQNIHLERAGQVWDVLVRLGLPRCGYDRIHVGHWDGGRVWRSNPAIYACGYTYAVPPPLIY